MARPATVLDTAPQMFKRSARIPVRGSHWWRIHAGVVRTITWNYEGAVVPLGFWGQGSIVGAAVALVDHYDIQCLTPVMAVPLDSQYQLTARVSAAHLQQAQQLLYILHSRRVDCRLMQFLQWLGMNLGYPVGQGWRLPFRPTHQEIAETIGSTRVTITRLLHQLVEEEQLVWSKQPHILPVNCDRQLIQLQGRMTSLGG
ncbi:cAMP-binding domain protein [Halomicronema hongdechloris C2206]|uniref:cAMP-binding domain protein n=1 Tax=Halomicronema hongdechloris C2206 TaxID=1641165 RepID=A0A1Z3HP16_9CYAN|nr:Crp/Fnr family transcriptional regulator [Halomicronema hongdechloris]ASC72020.1 cAMP-binding domain protein [Halomicronema hongdechloris C2206]